MSLESKRKIKDLTENVLPGRVKEIEEICGAPIPFEVDWASFGDDLEALNFLDNLSCHRLNMALRTICVDDMGKEAVRDAVKKVKLKNVAKAEDRSLALADGALEMSCAYALRTDGMHSDNAIREFLLSRL